MYQTVIRPTMTYGATVWHHPKDVGQEKCAWKEVKLEQAQNRCLRVVSGAFQATRITDLQAKTNTPPIRLHLNHVQMKARLRLATLEAGTEIREACRKIQCRMRPSRGRPRLEEVTPAQQSAQLINTALGVDAAKRLKTRPPFLRLPWETGHPLTPESDPPPDATLATRQLHDLGSKLKSEMARRWEVSRLTAGGEVEHKKPQAKLRLYDGLTKPESSLVIQIRTGKIGLADFLHRQQVPGFETAACQCGFTNQTAKHVLIFCNIHAQKRHRLFDEAKTQDFFTMISTNQGLRAATRWLISLGILGQFEWARSTL